MTRDGAPYASPHRLGTRTEEGYKALGSPVHTGNQGRSLSRPRAFGFTENMTVPPDRVASLNRGVISLNRSAISLNLGAISVNRGAILLNWGAMSLNRGAISLSQKSWFYQRLLRNNGNKATRAPVHASSSEHRHRLKSGLPRRRVSP